MKCEPARFLRSCTGLHSAQLHSAQANTSRTPRETGYSRERRALASHLGHRQARNAWVFSGNDGRRSEDETAVYTFSRGLKGGTSRTECRMRGKDLGTYMSDESGCEGEAGQGGERCGGPFIGSE